MNTLVIEKPRPLVGVGVLIRKRGRVLIGKRKGSHGAAEYAGTGGHVEYMERITDSVIGETLQETGLTITNIKFLCVVNLRKYTPKHYVDIGFTADWHSGDPKVVEPDKAESWAWYYPKDIPHPRFGAVDQYLEALKTGRTFFDL